MTKVFIFWGPKEKFNEEIPKNYTTLSDLVNTFDNYRNTYRIVSDNVIKALKYEYDFFEDLVAFGDEFHSVNESFMLSFVSRISSIEFDSIFLHNPPYNIIQQFKRSNVNIEEKNYEYSNITRNLIREIDNEYDKYIVGQADVKREILLSLISLLNEHNSKPVVLMFYGPSGVGKTETAKFISQKLGGNLFRQQFSMFQSSKYLAYLYGDSINEGSFALDLLERKTNVIFLDEFDKVDTHFHSAFYELFDEGIYKDKNYKVNLKKSIIICTSNYGDEQQVKSHLGEAMYSRIDNVIEFNSLSGSDKVTLINMKVEQKLNDYNKNQRELIDQLKIINILKENLESIVNVREIDRSVQKLISLELLNGILKNG